MILVLGLAMTTSMAHAQFGNLLDKAKEAVGMDDSNLDVSGGLKQALEVGVDDAVSSLSKTGGYFESPYKILVPEEASKIVSTVSKLPGLTNVETDLIAKMNQAAELSAKKAGPIFFEAIKQMNFQDATNILMGEEDAATRYLQRTSGQKLYDEFMPIIQSSLDEVDARSLWNKAVNAYNKVPFQKKLNPDLDDHVNNMAIQGMFSLVEEKEKGIRQNPALRTSPLLKKVFAQQDE